ncbi:MAG: phosphate ABC transporter substrate-binding/OmpA family protein [Desulfobacteraceae bacterium]|jgi:ABC-type nitrate/sulfonate/bicarbonate transport system substrate-binding protein
MSDQKTKGILVAAVMWVLIIGILSVAAKYFILPYFEKDLLDDTGSESAYKHTVTLAADSFSGYSILRSPVMKKELKALGIKLDIKDDNADYDARMEALSKKDVNMAVFTIDSFILAGSRLGNFPATMVMVIDESKGGDAMVAWKNAVSRVEDLNNASAGIVLTAHSPSEFLARTVIAHFNLPLLPEKWLITAEGSKDVYKEFIKADKKDKRAYVLWEPYVSKALKDKDAHVILDSSKLKGYIVDVLVVERNFLKDNHDLVKSVVSSYLKSAHAYSQSRPDMEKLVVEDAGLTGSESLDADTAARMVDRIEWKNTRENYSHFGLEDGSAQGIMTMEEMIGNIRDVLVKTGALSGNPIDGQEHTLFHNKILGDLKASDFHPGKKMDVIQGLGPSVSDLEAARQTPRLGSLDDKAWAALVPVGSLKIEPIMFARGTARLNIKSERDLDDLARRLQSFPGYYLKVIGHTRSEGDLDANMKLAAERADAALNRLISAGADISRVRAETSRPTGSDGDNQSVSFVVGEAPF